MRILHHTKCANVCNTLRDASCDTRGYRHARASYGPPRATRAANGPGTIGSGPGPAPAAATPAVASSGGGQRCCGSCGCCHRPSAGAVARVVARRAATPLADASPSAATPAAAVRAVAEPLPSPGPGGSTCGGLIMSLPRGVWCHDTPRGRPQEYPSESHHKRLQQSPKCSLNSFSIRSVGQLAHRAQLDVEVDTFTCRTGNCCTNVTRQQMHKEG